VLFVTFQIKNKKFKHPPFHHGIERGGPVRCWGEKICRNVRAGSLVLAHGTVGTRSARHGKAGQCFTLGATGFLLSLALLSPIVEFGGQLGLRAEQYIVACRAWCGLVVCRSIVVSQLAQVFKEFVDMIFTFLIKPNQVRAALLPHAAEGRVHPILTRPHPQRESKHAVPNQALSCTDVSTCTCVVRGSVEAILR
jgi:hypothetical protein